MNLNKYYRWRRRRIRENARNRRKIATHKYSYLHMHMTPREKKAYDRLGHKWYRSLNLKFGTDITGRNLSKDDLNDISDLPGEKEYKNKPPKPLVENPIVVTFGKVYRDDGTIHEYPLYNGEADHPIYGQQMSDTVRGWLERNGKPADE